MPAFNWKRDVSLVEGMKEIMPVYNVLGIIPAVCGMSNKIVVMERWLIFLNKSDIINMTNM